MWKSLASQPNSTFCQPSPWTHEGFKKKEREREQRARMKTQALQSLFLTLIRFAEKDLVRLLERAQKLLRQTRWPSGTLLFDVLKLRIGRGTRFCHAWELSGRCCVPRCTFLLWEHNLCNSLLTKEIPGGTIQPMRKATLPRIWSPASPLPTLSYKTRDRRITGPSLPWRTPMDGMCVYARKSQLFLSHRNSPLL